MSETSTNTSHEHRFFFYLTSGWFRWRGRSRDLPYVHESQRRLADVNMGTRGHPSHRVAKRNEGNSRSPKVGNESATFYAVGLYGDIHRFPVIESHPVMRGRLAHSADRHFMSKVAQEKLRDFARIFERPVRLAVVANESPRDDVLSGG